MSPRQFIALCLVSMVMFTGIAVGAAWLIDYSSWLLMLGSAALGFLYPRIWLRDSLKKRRKEIVRALPTFLDFLTMGVEAGLTWQAPLRKLYRRGRPGR